MRLDCVVPLERRKHANIEWLQDMRAVWRHNKKVDIILHTMRNEFALYMAPMPVGDKETPATRSRLARLRLENIL
jgi:hypothetical protein